MASSRVSTEILQSSNLELFIPANSKIDLTEAVRVKSTDREFRPDSLPSSASGTLFQIAQRSLLFYDEKLPVFIALVLDLAEESQAQYYLSQLALSIEAVAIDDYKKEGQQSKHNDGIHILYSKILGNGEISWTIVKQNERLVAISKIHVTLEGHPRVRLVNPRVAFMASAKLRPAEQASPSLWEEYLTNRQGFGVNLLEPYNDDPSVAPFRPRLSALRVSRVSPASNSSRDVPTALTYKSKTTVYIYPAINVRLRHSQIITGSKHSIIASLDVEVSSYGECDVLIESVELTMTGGRSNQIGGPYCSTLPIRCRPRDDVTFLYSLEPSDPIALDTPTVNNNNTVKPITVKLQVTALLSGECHAVISTNWNTVIDFAIPVSLGQNSRSSRVLAAPGGFGTSVLSPKLQILEPAFHESPDLQFPTQPLDIYLEPMGLAVTFSGPLKVYVGEAFSWNVSVVNRSSRVRRLALVVPHKKWKGDLGKSLPQAPNETTEHVVEEVVLHSTHRSQHLEPAELVCLMNDIRIGPLPPSACHATELKFIALSAGVLSVEVVRIIDLSNPNSNETTECRDLPSIVAVHR